MLTRQPFRRLRKVQLDDFRRAGTHEEQQLDFGAPGDQPRNHPVDFVLRIGHAGEVALFQNGRGKARFGKDHHACRRLDQMRTGTRSDDEEERILDLAMQPDDAGQAAEDCALAGIADDRRCRGHAVTVISAALLRAMRNFSRNCAAFTA